MRRVVLATALVALSGARSASGADDTVRIKGSDTIGGRAMPEIAEAYVKKNPGAQVAVDALGSSTAFVGLFDGSAEIGESSRPITEKEQATAKDMGLKLQELVIGYDGVAVIVHPDNPVTDLTVTQLSALFSGKARSWKDVGGKDSPVRLISRPSYSGTQAFFKEKAVRRGDAKGPEEFAASTEIMEENGEIIRAVASDPKAVSYVGLGWVAASVKAVPIVGKPGEKAIPPSSESVRTGKYPLYRPLLMYVPSSAKPATADFIRFVFSAEGSAIMAKNGFIPPDAATPLPAFLATARPATPARPATSAVSAPASAPAASVPVAAASSAAAASPAEPARPPAELPAVKRREVVRVTFASSAVALGPEGQRLVDDVARRLAQGGLHATLTGHADSKGSAALNERIARARANAVAARLLQQGVPQAAFRVESAAADAPVATNESTSGRARNRRVDVELIPR